MVALLMAKFGKSGQYWPEAVETRAICAVAGRVRLGADVGLDQFIGAVEVLRHPELWGPGYRVRSPVSSLDE